MLSSKYRQMRAARDQRDNRRRHKTQNKNDIITSSLCSDALNNPDSELSRFLFIQDSNTSNANDAGNSTSISSKMPSIKSNRGWCYCLSLESLQVRSERVVFMFEANALFSALFLSGTWVLYEWGSVYGYGGVESPEIVSQLFEVIMIIALSANIMLAFFASMMWIMSLNFSATNPNWTYSCRNIMVYCQMLFTFMLMMVSFGLILAIIQKFYPNYYITIIVIALIILIEIPGMAYITQLVNTELPLELYHSPLWWKLFMSPSALFSKSSREQIQVNAIQRAKVLRERFCKDRGHTTTLAHHGNGSMERLLKRAAESIGRSDLDVSVYIASLEDDLYTDVEHLIGEDVDMLALYMPRRLAKEVYRLLEG